MRHSIIPTILYSLVLGTGLLAGDTMLGPSLAGENRAAPAAAGGQWLSIGEVHQKLEAAGFRNVEKIEREHGMYEARASDRNGTRVKLSVNPQSGEVSERSDRRKRDRETDAADRRPRAGSMSAECNERRCRDDLPQSAPPAQPLAR